MLSYIHKNKEGQDIYYFANSSDDTVETVTRLRGKIRPELMDPATGEVSTILQVKYINRNGQVYTCIPLKLKAVSSVFVVARK